MVSVFEDTTRERRTSRWENRVPALYGLRDPVVRRSLALLALVAALVLFFVLRGPDRRSYTFNRSGRPGLAQAVWDRASPAVARQAVTIAGSDATLTRLLRAGDGHRLPVVGPWSVGNDSRGGAVVVYKLARPIVVDSDLPYVAIPPDGPAHGTCVVPYAPGWEHLRASGVTELRVLVDVSRGRVAEIDTNARTGRVSPVAGKPYPACNEEQ